MGFTFIKDNSAGATASAGSIGVALTGVTAGNLVAVWVAHEGAATTITVSDGTSTFEARTKTTHAGGEPHGQWFYLLSANGGDKTYTATFGANRTYRAIAVAEFSYMGGDLAYDTEALNQATAATHTSGNLTTASTDELVFGGLKIFGSATIQNHTINAVAADGYENEAGKFLAIWYKSFTGTFTGAATATSNGGSIEYVCNAIAFKITAAGGGGSAYTRITSESLGITDSVSRSVGMTRRPADSLGLTDSANRYAALARRTVESLGITDSTQRYASFLREAQDLLGITDEEVIQAAYLRILSDDLGVSDSTFRSQGHGRYVTDDVGISDAMNTLLFVLIYRTVADSMGITDEQARMVDVVRILSDSMGISDELDKASAIQRIMSETMGMTDSIDRTMAVIRNIADQLDIEDSAHRALTHIRFLAEALGITDSTNATVAAAAVAVWLMIALSLQRMIRVEAAKPFCSISVCRSFITLEAYKL